MHPCSNVGSFGHHYSKVQRSQNTATLQRIRQGEEPDGQMIIKVLNKIPGKLNIFEKGNEGENKLMLQLGLTEHAAAVCIQFPCAMKDYY